MASDKIILAKSPHPRYTVGMAKLGRTKIARWESRSGKYWVDLYFNPTFKLADGRVVADASYRGNGCGGSVSGATEAEAIAAMQRRIDHGGFQPDAAKTPMRRVAWVFL